MSLEATMIMVDNSDYSRNGDFLPTRWEAQKDAVSIISNKKMSSHPDNSVGLMTTAGKQVEVLCTPCQDQSLLIASLHEVNQGGQSQFSIGVQIAYLALKHRQNKQQRQRIVAIVASPISEDENKLINLAKKLKKNNVAVDIINMGQIEQDHVRKLEKFIENVNNSDNSHYLNINPGINPSDQLYGTSVMGAQEGGQEGGFGQQGGFDAELGFDPNLEPELALAMRISLEEEKRRQEQEQQRQQGQQGQTQNENQAKMEIEPNQQTVQQQQPVQQLQGDVNLDDELEQDELLKRAMELSLQDVPQEQQQQVQQPQQGGQSQDVFQDQNFVNELLGMIPELNKNDEQLKKALDEVQKNKDNNNQNDNNNNNNNQ